MKNSVVKDKPLLLTIETIFYASVCLIFTEFFSTFLLIEYLGFSWPKTPWLGIGLPVFLQILISGYLGFLIYQKQNMSYFLGVLCLLVHVFCLGVFFYTLGGHVNPFISLLLFPVILSVFLLSWPITWLIGLLSMLTYTFLIFKYQPLVQTNHHSNDFFHLHLVGMWINFGISLLIVLIVLTPFVHRSKLQQKKIQQAELKQKQDEHMLGLGLSAANIIHRFSTPLNTLSLLVEDFQYEIKDQTQKQQEILDAFAHQLDRCITLLHQWREKNNFTSLQQNREITLETFIRSVQDQFLWIHPGRQLTVRLDASETAFIQTHLLFEHALLNFIDNAAKACEKNPELSIQQIQGLDQKTVWELIVTDQGEGFLYHDWQTSDWHKNLNSGGVGIPLSHHTLEQLGARVWVKSNKSGTVVLIHWPNFT
jgi:two-component system sensor histidine kinase RegB